jgi:hypothetical protein
MLILSDEQRKALVEAAKALAAAKKIIEGVLQKAQ